MDVKSLSAAFAREFAAMEPDALRFHLLLLPGQKSRVERLMAKVEALLTQGTVDDNNDQATKITKRLWSHTSILGDV